LSPVVHYRHFYCELDAYKKSFYQYVTEKIKSDKQQGAIGGVFNAGGGYWKNLSGFLIAVDVRINFGNMRAFGRKS